MYKAIYREYRPEVFSEVLGQDHIIRVLQSQVASDKVSHAYLFCGTRGTGKTTVARLLAKAVNCTSEGKRPCGECENCRAIKNGNFVDLIEIDAASNNGVEHVRELRESVNYPPVVGRKKVYILDEAHQLTGSAANALLKTLEEPPENVIFILCTTEPEKLLQTILSRCLQMDFKRVTEQALLERMKYICENSELDVEENGLKLIATFADGSARDCLSILEQCIAGRRGKVTRNDILDALGAVGEDSYIALTDAVKRNDVQRGFMIIEELLNKGKDSRQIIQGWMSHFRNLLIVKFVRDPENVISMSLENIERVRSQSEELELGEINGAIRELSRTLYDAKRSSTPRVLLEMAMVKLGTGDGYDENFRGMKAKSYAMPIGDVAKAAPVMAQAPVMPKAEEATPVEEPVMAAEEDYYDESPSTADMYMEQTPVAPASEPSISAEAAADYNLDRVWEAFLNQGEKEIGGFFLTVRDKAIPISFENGNLTVSASGMTLDYMEKYTDDLSKMLTSIVGSQSSVIVKDEAAPVAVKKPEGDMASMLSQMLGMDVEIK